jgi:hypothetical protein
VAATGETAAVVDGGEAVRVRVALLLDALAPGQNWASLVAWTWYHDTVHLEDVGEAVGMATVPHAAPHEAAMDFGIAEVQACGVVLLKLLAKVEVFLHLPPMCPGLVEGKTPWSSKSPEPKCKERHQIVTC